jgi:multiple sugar transport system substrate-binding protein
MRGKGDNMIRGLAAVAVFVLLSTSFAQTRLTLAAHYSPEEAASLTPCFEQYEAETGVGIDYQQIAYGDYLQTVLTSRLSGQAPDIYHLYSIWGAQMIENEVLAAPPQEVVDFVTGNYVETTVGAATINDQLWGIPTEVSNYMLVYNKKLFAEAGLEAPPATWDELVEMAAAMTKRNDQGNIIQAGYAFGPEVAPTVHPFLTQLYSRNIDLFKEDYSGTNLTTPEAAEVLRAQVALFQNGSTDTSVELWDFPSGTVAMMTMAPWYKATLQEAFGDEFENMVGVAPIPAGEDWRSLQYAFFFGVDAQSENQEAAWQFLTWLNTAQNEGDVSCMGNMLLELGALTGNNNDITAAGDRLSDSFTQPYVDALERSITEPNVVQASEIEAILKNYIDLAWAGQLSPEDALVAADQEITGILQEFY